MTKRRWEIVLLLTLVFFTTPLLGKTRKGAYMPKPLTPVPAPRRIPTAADSVVKIGSLRLSFSLYLWQDFMPIVPPGGPPFHLSLEVTVKNQGTKPVTDFRLEKLSLYYDKSRRLFWTFRLASADSASGTLSIAPGAKRTFAYGPKSPGPRNIKLKEGTVLYGRVLGRVKGEKSIITLPPAGVNLTY